MPRAEAGVLATAYYVALRTRAEPARNGNSAGSSTNLIRRRNGARVILPVRCCRGSLAACAATSDLLHTSQRACYHRRMPKPPVPAAPTTLSQHRVLFESWQLHRIPVSRRSSCAASACCVSWMSRCATADAGVRCGAEKQDRRVDLGLPRGPSYAAYTTRIGPFAASTQGANT